MLLPAGITILVMSGQENGATDHLSRLASDCWREQEVWRRGGCADFFFLAKFITDTQLTTQGKTELCFDF